MAKLLVNFSKEGNATSTCFGSGGVFFDGHVAEAPAEATGEVSGGFTGCIGAVAMVTDEAPFGRSAEGAGVDVKVADVFVPAGKRPVAAGGTRKSTEAAEIAKE